MRLLLNRVLLVLFSTYLIESTNITESDEYNLIKFKSDKSENVSLENAQEKISEVYYDNENEYLDKKNIENSISKAEDASKKSGNRKEAQVSESFPNEVFLTLRNLSSDDSPVFKEFTEKNNFVDLQASATEVVNTTREDDQKKLDSPGINSRAQRETSYSPTEIDRSSEVGLHLPYTHSKIDTAELSDCAKQGEWIPMAPPPGLYKTGAVGDVLHGQGDILQSVGSFPVGDQIIPHWQESFAPNGNPSAQHQSGKPFLDVLSQSSGAHVYGHGSGGGHDNDAFSSFPSGSSYSGFGGSGSSSALSSGGGHFDGNQGGSGYGSGGLYSNYGSGGLYSNYGTGGDFSSYGLGGGGLSNFELGGGFSSQGSAGGYSNHGGAHSSHGSFGGGSFSNFGSIKSHPHGGHGAGKYSKLKPGSMYSPPPVPPIIIGKKPGHWKSQKSKHKVHHGKRKRPSGSVSFPGLDSSIYVGYGSGGSGGYSGFSSQSGHGGFGGGSLSSGPVKYIGGTKFKGPEFPLKGGISASYVHTNLGGNSVSSVVSHHEGLKGPSNHNSGVGGFASYIRYGGGKAHPVQDLLHPNIGGSTSIIQLGNSGSSIHHVGGSSSTTPSLFSEGLSGNSVTYPEKGGSSFASGFSHYVKDGSDLSSVSSAFGDEAGSGLGGADSHLHYGGGSLNSVGGVSGGLHYGGGGASGVGGISGGLHYGDSSGSNLGGASHSLHFGNGGSNVGAVFNGPHYGDAGGNGLGSAVTLHYGISSEGGGTSASSHYGDGGSSSVEESSGSLHYGDGDTSGGGGVASSAAGGASGSLHYEGGSGSVSVGASGGSGYLGDGSADADAHQVSDGYRHQGSAETTIIIQETPGSEGEGDHLGGATGYHGDSPSSSSLDNVPADVETVSPGYNSGPISGNLVATPSLDFAHGDGNNAGSLVSGNSISSFSHGGGTGAGGVALVSGFPEAAFLLPHQNYLPTDEKLIPDASFLSSQVTQGVRGGNSLSDPAYLSSHNNGDFILLAHGVLDDSSSSTFTCGKNQDHNTKYHTATFQVADNDHPSAVDVIKYHGDSAVLVRAQNSQFHDDIFPERKNFNPPDRDSSNAESSNALSSISSTGVSESGIKETTENENAKNGKQYKYSIYDTKPQTFTQEANDLVKTESDIYTFYHSNHDQSIKSGQENAEFSPNKPKGSQSVQSRPGFKRPPIKYNPNTGKPYFNRKPFRNLNQDKQPSQLPRKNKFGHLQGPRGTIKGPRAPDSFPAAKFRNQPQKSPVFVRRTENTSPKIIRVVHS